MAPQYTLHYFNLKGGRGESLRYLLAYDGVDYTDHRISFPEWPEYKKTTPLGFLPILELSDGTKISEMLTIAGYLAEKHGGWLTTPEENARIHQIAEYMSTDIGGQFFSKYAFERDEEKKTANAKVLMEEVFPKMFKNLYQLTGFANGAKWLSGDDRVSWVDFVVAAFVELFDETPRLFNGKMAEKGAGGKAFVEHLKRVQALPGVREHIAKRP